MKTAAFITVRTDSERLPRKPFLPLNGKPLIQHILERSRKIGADMEIVCTSDRRADDYLSSFCEELGFTVFRGSLEDKLDRWSEACWAHEIDAFVNVDADDPFFDFDLMRLALGHNVKNDPQLPVGCFTYAMTRKKVESICAQANRVATEYIDPYIDADFEPIAWKSLGQYREYRLTLDYEQDLYFFSRIFKELDIVRNNAPTLGVLEAIKGMDPVWYLHNSGMAKEWRERQLAGMK